METETHTVNKNCIQRKSKAVQLQHAKYSRRLVTCCFDSAFLQQPLGLVSSLSTYLDKTNSCNTPLPDWVNMHPPVIKPFSPGEMGSSGPVPLPWSISWQRYTPEDHSESFVHLVVSDLPNVLIVLLQESLKRLTSTDPESNPEFDKFVNCLRGLCRPTSLAFFSKSTNSKFYSVIAKLQLEGVADGFYQISSVEDLALIISNHTKSIAQRPLKEGRMEESNGFSFLPKTVRRGLVFSAASNRSNFRYPKSDVVCASAKTQTEADVLWNTSVRAWVNRTWLSQLGQWRGVTGEIATAIAAVYPTPRSLFEAISNSASSTSGDAVVDPNAAYQLLSDLPIRRGAGVLATQTRLGPQLAKQIVHFLTSSNSFD